MNSHHCREIVTIKRARISFLQGVNLSLGIGIWSFMGGEVSYLKLLQLGIKFFFKFAYLFGCFYPRYQMLKEVTTMVV